MTFLLPEHVRPAPFVPGNVIIINKVTLTGIIIKVFLPTFGSVFFQRIRSFWLVWPLCAGTLSFRWIGTAIPFGRSFVLRSDPWPGPSACKWLDFYVGRAIHNNKTTKQQKHLKTLSKESYLKNEWCSTEHFHRCLQAFSFLKRNTKVCSWKQQLQKTLWNRFPWK